MRTHESFIRRHLGPSDADVASMLRVVGATSLQELIDQTVPQSIMLTESLKLSTSNDRSRDLTGVTGDG